ncbi:MAG: SWIM zinc finger family protein [Ardenticatenales bacterium]|nr:SWIM zinc finger family protein [Ardenticatenales bacterium]
MTPTQPPPLTPKEVRALARDDALFERGEQLWQRGEVMAPSRRGRLLLAEVRGTISAPYQVEVEALQSKKRWAWHCTCPYFEIHGGPCKHGIALLLHWATHSDHFTVEASLDEQLAGKERARWLALLREALHDSPHLRQLLEIEPEPKKPLGRPLALAPYEEQLHYALKRYAGAEEKQVRLFRGVLETAAGFLRVGDGANAARLTSLLVETLVTLTERSKGLHRLLADALTLLEAAALDAIWEPQEQVAWLKRVMGWWETLAVTVDAETINRLMDLVLHCYRAEDRDTVEGWLRGLLRRPVQGNRLSNTLWRQRILAFLLAFYQAAGQTHAFLDLCWEEGEDALAARKLVERGELAEVLRLARQGLGTCQAHREVAAALHEVGEAQGAWQVAQEGLRYHDQGRGTLLAWLAARALEQKSVDQALTLARQAWEQGATLERYQLLREAAQCAEEWSDLRRNLHATLEYRGEGALLVEILIEEEAWRSAAALLPATGGRREELTEAVARGMRHHLPGEAVQLLFDLAELRTDLKTRPAYAQAAQALLAARSLAEATTYEALYHARLSAFLDSHSRRPALRDELSKRGIIAP